MSDESQLLRVAHAQRVISKALCDIAFQPFALEYMSNSHELIGKLDAIACQIQKLNCGNTGGERAEIIWRSLTTRALQSLENTVVTDSDSMAQRSLVRSRVDAITTEIYHTLSLLVSATQASQFQTKIRNLASLAVSTWNCAETCELKLSVCPSLSPARQAEWHSEFDDKNHLEGVSSTRSQIFTLFPRVMAREILMTDADAAEDLPGSWPKVVSQASDTCIHPGRGLREQSSLVVKGKQEEAERQAEEEEKQRLAKEASDDVLKNYKSQNKRKHSNTTTESITGLEGPGINLGGSGSG